MRVLPYSFGIFTACGIWRPLNWSSGWKKIIYDFYTFFVLALIYSFGLTEFIDALQCFGRIEDMISASFMLLTVGNTFCKAVNILRRREDIIYILRILNNTICQAKDWEEERVKDECNRRIRNNAMWFFCIVESAVFTITMSSIIKNIPNHTLPFRAWVPFNHSAGFYYWTMYYHQVVAHAIEATIAIGYDTFVPGIMLLTCAQLQILKHRNQNMLKNVERTKEMTTNVKINLEKTFLNNSIYHHKLILQFARLSNDVFSMIIFIQYAVSSFVICISVYRLAKMEIKNPEYPFAVFYLLCMMTQIFYYCWYGNEVILESLAISESIYKMNWSFLNLTTQKNLLMIMNRSTHPIVFTSGKILILSLDSFTGIIKLSYTAFNVLQQK